MWEHLAVHVCGRLVCEQCWDVHLSLCIHTNGDTTAWRGESPLDLSEEFFVHVVEFLISQDKQANVETEVGSSRPIDSEEGQVVAGDLAWQTSQLGGEGMNSEDYDATPIFAPECKNE